MNATKQSVFIAVSLDGYIARSNGDVDWLEAYEDKNEDYGFQEFMASVDALVMGRRTFEKVLSLGSWPYGSQKVVVLSSRSLTLPEKISDRVDILSGTPEKIIQELADREFFHLYIDGGQTIGGFLDAGFIQEMIITRIPVLIGSGITLAGELENDIRLEHKSTKTFESGLVQSRYKVMTKQ